MHDILFYIFSAMALGCGFLVVANPFSRNPVTSAMFLVLTIVALAGLFVLLEAFFLGAVQILVYAGAVMVLFLFVIMLLDLKEEEQRHAKKVGLVCGTAAAAGIAGIMIAVFTHADSAGAGTSPPLANTTAALGDLLFRQYLLPFEILSVLLLVAMVGVILLSKKEVS